MPRLKNSQKWGTYVRFCNESGIQIDSRLAKFNARYKLAGAFTGLIAEGIEKTTLDVYSVIAKVALSYSALEALEKALVVAPQKNQSRHPVTSPNIAAALREGHFTRLIELITESEDNEYRRSKLQNRIMQIGENLDTADARPFAEGIRHVFFHGMFTAHAAKLIGRRHDRLLLLEFGQEVLDAADLEFANWLKSQMKPPIR
jgi:hypothetical protein